MAEWLAWFKRVLRYNNVIEEVVGRANKQRNICVRNSQGLRLSTALYFFAFFDRWARGENAERKAVDSLPGPWRNKTRNLIEKICGKRDKMTISVEGCPRSQIEVV